MHTGSGKLVETSLDSGGWITCASGLIPAPGQYLLAHADGSDAPLPVPVFFSDPAPNGFRAAQPLPPEWIPGTALHLRGPLGRGFSLPPSARHVALVAFDGSPARLRGLIEPALEQEASLALVCSHAPADLPEVLEVHPLDAFLEIWRWADYVALDAARESLSGLRGMLDGAGRVLLRQQAQILVRTPMPCGTLAECGVCAVSSRNGWLMVCRDGPVFELHDLM
jgi:hypothetical protein